MAMVIPAPQTDAKTRQTAMWCHLAGAIASGLHLASGGGITVFLFLVPLIIWLGAREDSSFVDDHGREAVNFQISLIVYFIVGNVIESIIHWDFAEPIGVLGLIGTILAAAAANRGEYFRYPMCLRPLREPRVLNPEGGPVGPS